MRGLKIDAGYCIELESDMITMKGEPKQVLSGLTVTVGTSFEGHGVFGGSSIRRVFFCEIFLFSLAIISVCRYKRKEGRGAC